MPPKQRHTEETDTADTFLSAMRVKTVAVFISTLMVLYAFFGSIYRIPIQMEQHSKEILRIETTLESVNAKLIEVEKRVISKDEMLTEAVRTRARVDALEKAEVMQVATQGQITRLNSDWKEITQQLDSLSTQLSALGANVAMLKEAMTETRKAVDELKRK